MRMDSRGAQEKPKGCDDSILNFGNHYSVYRNLRNLGHPDITVGHPKELLWIIKSRKKNNHVDSGKLARRD